MPNTIQQNLKFQKIITLVGVTLFIAKLIAWQLTDSVAVLTDALESTVNVIAGFMGWYSLYLSAKPKDMDHPYGHGKAEFISAGIEGGLVLLGGIVIIYEAVINFKTPHEIQHLDIGMIIIAASAAINYIVGWIAIKRGKKNNSLPLVSGGKHLQTDTYSTIGILVGLVLIKLTGLKWIDSSIAIVFAGIILYTGYKILREAFAGIMDEADTDLLHQVIQVLKENKSENWIDLHNLRIIKYGSILHLDCHLTLPWYYNIHEGHAEIDKLDKIIKDNFGYSVELFVHSDGCLDFSCQICNKANCPERKMPFEQSINWTLETVLSNKKQRLPS